MGTAGNNRSIPERCRTQSVLDAHPERTAKNSGMHRRQEAHGTKQMPEDIFRLRVVFGFLEELFDTVQVERLLVLLDAVSCNNGFSIYFPAWSIPGKYLIPFPSYA